MKRPLSFCQKKTLDFLRSYFCAHGGMAPTVRECAEHFHRCDSTVFAHLAALRKKGYIARTFQARSIVLKDPDSGNRLHCLPLFRSIDETRSFFEQEFDRVWMAQLPVRGKNCFAVEMPDDSLCRLGVREGDLVAAAWGEKPDAGDLAVVSLAGMPFVEPFAPDSSRRSVGKVIAVTRFYG